MPAAPDPRAPSEPVPSDLVRSEAVLPEAVLRGATGPAATLVVVTDNVIAMAIAAIGAVVAMPVVAIDHADGSTPARLEALGLTDRHAVVLTDHDAPGTAAVLRTVLAGNAGYLGMMGSRGRAGKLFEALRAEGVGEGDLARLHVPVGLDLGGSRTAGLIALSVVAEVAAWANGKLTRDGDRSGLKHPDIRTP